MTLRTPPKFLPFPLLALLCGPLVACDVQVTAGTGDAQATGAPSADKLGACFRSCGVNPTTFRIQTRELMPAPVIPEHLR